MATSSSIMKAVTIPNDGILFDPTYVILGMMDTENKFKLLRFDYGAATVNAVWHVTTSRDGMANFVKYGESGSQALYAGGTEKINGASQSTFLSKRKISDGTQVWTIGYT